MNPPRAEEYLKLDELVDRIKYGNSTIRAWVASGYLSWDQLVCARPTSDTFRASFAARLEWVSAHAYDIVDINAQLGELGGAFGNLIAQLSDRTVAASDSGTEIGDFGPIGAA